MRIIDELLQNIRAAAVYNPDVQVAPACILWPDKDRQWEAIMPRLQAEMPELLILGEYVPEKRTGPAIWLRCVMAGTVEDVILPGDLTPTIYLPGFSRQDLRAVETCPEALQPLAELQFRGTIWSQVNARDWTVPAFLKSEQGGLGLDVAMDNGARNTMQLALYRLLDEEMDLLRDRRMDSDYFNTLLTGGDPVRDLLQWLDQEDVFRNSRGENEWKAFVAVCKSQFGFDPQKEGILTGASRLASREGPWNAVWERFCEAPKRYPNIPGLIRKCSPPNDSVFWSSSDGDYDGWPQWNDDQEKSLRRDLQAAGNLPAPEARKKLIDLEARHGHRRRLVWAELGESPMAMAIKHLAVLADRTGRNLAAGSVADLAEGYRNDGWQADDAVMRALEQVERHGDLEPICIAIRTVYMPWAEESARYLQKIWNPSEKPTALHKQSMAHNCILFVDGLRYDIARRLTHMLEGQGLAVDQNDCWAALPSVTGTGKPAVAPLRNNQDLLAEEAEGFNFEILTGYHLNKAIEDSGYQILDRKSPIDTSSKPEKVWCEYGDIDHEGHDRGWKLARHIHVVLSEVSERIHGLLDAGWETIHVVTDHGWLLIPQGLPKTELPAALADTKWGRCAALKPGAQTEEMLYPWYWNPNQQFALAGGINCFKKNLEFAHGGLSLQECLIPRLTVSRKSGASPTVSIEFTDVVWKGMRCTIGVDGNFEGLSADIRLQAGDPSASVVVGVKKLKSNGTASMVVENEDLEGRDAALVLLDANGAMVAQAAVIIGGGEND